MPFSRTAGAYDDAINIEPISNALGISSLASPKSLNPLAKPFNPPNLANTTPITKYDEYASTDSDSDSDDMDNEITYYGIRLDPRAASPNLRQFIPRDISVVYTTILEKWVNPTSSQKKFAAQKAAWTYMVNASKYIKAFRGVRCPKLQPNKNLNLGFPQGMPYPYRRVEDDKPEGDVVVNDDGRSHGVMGPKGGAWKGHWGSKLRWMSIA